MKVHNIVMAIAAAAAMAAPALAAGAQTQAGTDSLRLAQAAAAPAAAQADGEVRKIDREQGKLTLRHGPLPNLDMPPMTMVFRVADPRLLDGLKDGDKVRFSAEKVNGAFTVTAIRVVKPD